MQGTESTPVNYRTLLERLHGAVKGKHISSVRSILAQNKDIVYIAGAWQSAQVYNGKDVGLYIQWNGEGYIFSADFCKAENPEELKILRVGKSRDVSVRPDVFITPYSIQEKEAVGKNGESLDGLIRAAEAAA